MQIFRVFFSNGTRADVEAATFGRDGMDWVLYEGRNITTSGVAARYPAAQVNGISMQSPG